MSRRRRPASRPHFLRHRLTIPTVVTAILLASLAGTAMAAGGSPSPTTVAPSKQTTTQRLLTMASNTDSAAADRKAPSFPMKLAVTAASATSITLSWNASRDNVRVAGYGLYVNGARVASTTLKSFKFATLTCGTSYKLGVDAYDGSQNRSKIASVLSATAPCLDAIAPSAPGSVRQTSSAQTGLTLEWTAASDNVGVAGYTVYRDGIPVATTQQHSVWVGNLVCGAGYSVAVDAYDAAGNHSARTGAFVTTEGCSDSTPPSAPGQLVVSGSTATSFSVSWLPSSDDRGVAGYRMSVNGSAYATTTSTSMTVGGLSCGVSASLALVAFDAAGNTSSASHAIAATAACAPTLDTQAPSSPAGLTRSGGTASSVSLTWDAATDNVGVTGYGIYRDGTKIGDSAVTTYTPNGLACGTSYTFAVDAVDAAGNRSSRPSIVAATSACQNTQAPTAPTGLGSLGRTETSITFAWQASSDDVAVSGYRVYRDGVQLGSTTSTSYLAGSLACGTSYTFAVEAYDADGNHSARPATILFTAACSDATAPSAPGELQQSGTSQTSLTVSWAVATDNVGVAGYGLYVGNVATGTTAQSSYSFAGLTCGTTYTIGVDAYDAAGNRSQRVSVQASTSACTPPPPPPPPPSSGSGDRFVTSSGGSDANPCTQAQPCASFDRAYQVASPGQIVCVAPGNYSAQRISYVSGRTTPNVVIQGCGGSVSVLSLAVGANSGTTQPCCVTFKDIAITGSSSARAVFIYWGNKSPSSRAADITFDGVRIAVGQPTNGPIFEAFTTLRLTVKNSVIGPACCGNNAAGQSNGSPVGIRIGTADRVSAGWPTNDDIVIDNNLVQGITRSTSQWLAGYGPPPQSSCVNTGDVCHADAIQIYGATNLKITSNRLYHNEVQGIFLDSTDPFINGVIEDNMIGDVMDDLVGGAGATAGISLDGRALAGTWSIANNTLATGEQISVVNTAQIPAGTTISVKGNIGNWRATSNTTGTSCTGGASVFSFAYNVWGGLNSTSTGCSSSDVTGVPSFVNAALAPNATMDLHLGSTGMADNLVGSGCTGSDIDGQARASRCEAGADER